MLLLRCIAVGATLLSVGLATNLAKAEASVEQCAAAYTKGQEDRLAGRLFASRLQFAACSDAACPEAIVRDCSRWKLEVEADLPTAKIEVVDETGAPVRTFALFIDGERVPDELLSKPLVVDAGQHVFRIETPDHEPLQLEHAFTPEDRNVALRASLKAVGASEPSVGPKQPPEDVTPESDSKAARPFPTVPVVLASAGVVSLGASLFFGIGAKNRYDELKDDCGSSCTESQADEVKSKALISDVTLIVGVAAIGAAAWIYFSSDKSPTKTALGFEPRLDGARARLQFQF
jgi:hypothetical protein